MFDNWLALLLIVGLSLIAVGAFLVFISSKGKHAEKIDRDENIFTAIEEVRRDFQGSSQVD